MTSEGRVSTLPPMISPVEPSIDTQSPSSSSRPSLRSSPLLESTRTSRRQQYGRTRYGRTERIAGAGAFRVDYGKGELRSEGHEPLEEGDWVSIDGSTGEIIGGKMDTRSVRGHPGAARRITARRAVRDVPQFRPPAQVGGRDPHPRRPHECRTPNDARVARLFGAAGIGLCRTEHMFFSEDRILASAK